MSETITKPHLSYQPEVGEATASQPESIMRPIDESVAELMQRVKIGVTTEPEDSFFVDGTVNLKLRKMSWGSDFLAENIGAHNPHKMIDLSLPENRHFFDIAYQHVTTEPYLARRLLAHDGLSWVVTEAGSAAEKSLREVFSYETGRGNLDILNCTIENLSEEEIATIEQTVSRANALTGGRLLDRVSSVVLQGSEAFTQEYMGAFHPNTRTIRINLGWVRDAANNKAKFTDRYNVYFPGQTVNPFEVNLAHELGHAVDLLFAEEYQAYGLDRSKQRRRPSAFQNYFGWSSKMLAEPEAKETGIIDTEIDCSKEPPTEYGKTDPLEDFAETFAIICLGGKTDNLTERFRTMADHIQRLSTEGIIGPEKGRIIKKSKDGEIYEVKGKVNEIVISLEDA